MQLRGFCLFQYIIFMFQNIISESEHKCASEHLRKNKQKMSVEKKTIEKNYGNHKITKLSS